MVPLAELVSYCNALLQSEDFHDYAPNGLQVEGRTSVKRIATGVTASLEFLEAALAWQADAVLVHHGYFWKGESPRVVGMKNKRLRLLLAHDVSLLAYHLPLDVHPVYGNNAQLGRHLGLQCDGYLEAGGVANLLARGHLEHPMPAVQVAGLLGEQLARQPLHIAGGDHDIGTLAWCSGAAQDYIELAAAAGLDAYVSGEISEHTVHAARELGIHYFAAGHHATECYGCRALGEHLADYFTIEHRFVDIENPV